MNYKEINVEIIKCLFAKFDNFVRAQLVGDDQILLIPQPAFYGYVIPREKLYVSESRLTMIKKPLFVVSEFCKPENEITPTRKFEKYGDDYCRRFEGKANGKPGAVYLKEKFLTQIFRGDGDGCRFYQNVKPGEDMARKSVLAVSVERDKDGNEKFVPKMYIMPFDIRR